MAGKVVVSTLNNDTGVLATQNGMTGIAKAWVNFNGTSGTAVINSSFNISSITRNAAGRYTMNFTTVMANTGYAVTGSMESTAGNNTLQLYASSGGGSAPDVKTTSACMVNYSQGGTLGDPFSGSFIVLGS
jgi:hypothetical protein